MRSKKTKIQRVFNKIRLINLLKTQKRQQEVKLRQNFLPTLVLIFLLWSSLAYVVFFVDPGTTGAISIFFLLLFFTLLFTLSTLFANTRRGFFVSMSIMSFFGLAYLGIANIISILLIIAIAVIAEVYLMKS